MCVYYVYIYIYIYIFIYIYIIQFELISPKAAPCSSQGATQVLPLHNFQRLAQRAQNGFRLRGCSSYGNAIVAQFAMGKIELSMNCI